MTDEQGEINEDRVLLLAPTRKDGQLTATILRRAGIYSFACSDVEEVCEKFRDGVGALLIAEEVIPQRGGSARNLS